jgi:hypothetical protein
MLRVPGAGRSVRLYPRSTLDSPQNLDYDNWRNRLPLVRGSADAKVLLDLIEAGVCPSRPAASSFVSERP